MPVGPVSIGVKVQLNADGDTPSTRSYSNECLVLLCRVSCTRIAGVIVGIL